MAKRRVGIVGGGFAASNHIDALRRLTDVEVVAIADQSLELALAGAHTFGIPKAYGSVADLLADAEVEVVHNCTPNHLHAPVNRAVLESGKHLLSEKPLATTTTDTESLVELAAVKEREGLVAGVCFNYRHFPLVRQVKDMLASGEYGAVHFVHGGYLQDWLLYDTDWNWRLEVKQNGRSRAVADIGSHWSDLMQYTVGSEITAVCASLSRLYDVRYRPAQVGQTFSGIGGADREAVLVDTEDYGTVMLEFANGARGVFSVSQVSAGRKNRLYFEVDAGTAAFAWDQEEPNHLWVGRRDQPNVDMLRDPGLLLPQAARLARFPGGHQEGWPDGLRNLFRDFYNTVSARERGEEYHPSFASFREGHRIMQLVEAVLESDRRRGWVPIGAVGEETVR